MISASRRRRPEEVRGEEDAARRGRRARATARPSARSRRCRGPGRRPGRRPRSSACSSSGLIAVANSTRSYDITSSRTVRRGSPRNAVLRQSTPSSCGRPVVVREVDEEDLQARAVLVAPQALGERERLGQVVRREEWCSRCAWSRRSVERSWVAQHACAAVRPERREYQTRSRPGCPGQHLNEATSGRVRAARRLEERP